MTGITSCHKSDRSNDTELKSARDMSLALSSWNDVFRQLDVFASQQADVNSVPGPGIYTGCGTVTVVPALPSTVYPKTMTVNYGPTDCQGPDGAMRKGQLIMTFTGNYRDSLTFITISPVNYYFNDVAVNGTFTIRNKGMNSLGHPCFTETVSGGTCTSSTMNVTWNANFTKEWMVGSSTPYIFDDVYQISGTATGISTDNNSFAVYITAPLQFSLSCPWIEKGNLYLNPANIAHRYIDFGTGTCDNQADVWIFGTKMTLYQF
ncbi:MAG: hypothetical protein ACHQRM_04305 [Bacteroidia bacterium]